MATQEQTQYQWETQPQQMYNQSLGLPTTGRNPFQNWQAAQYIPRKAAWELGNLAGWGFGGPTGFRDYLNYNQDNPTNYRQQLSTLYGTLENSGPQQQQVAMDALGMDAFDMMNYYNLQNQYAPSVAAYHAGNRPAYQAQFNVSDAGMGGGNWMQWLRAQQGL